MQYVVVTVDIVNSRNKGNIKNEFIEKINQLNKTFSRDILVSFSMLRGDEIQGVLKVDITLFKVIRFLKMMLYKYQLKIGVGIGEIYQNQEINTVNSSWELNGPAFYHARDAMDLIESNKGKKEFSYYVYFKTRNDKLNKHFSLIYSYIDDYLNKWKEETYEIIFLEEKGLIHEQIAKEILKKDEEHPSEDEIKKMRINTTKKIQRSNWYKIKQTEEMLLELLREEFKD